MASMKLLDFMRRSHERLGSNLNHQKNCVYHHHVQSGLNFSFILHLHMDVTDSQPATIEVDIVPDDPVEDHPRSEEVVLYQESCSVNRNRRRRRRKKETGLVNVKPWSRNMMSMKLKKYPSNPVYAYDRKLTPVTPPKDTMMKVFDIQSMRKSAEAHRQVRRHVQSFLKPGVSLTDICARLEAKTKELLGDSLKSGIGFPTGLSLNECAAHDSAIPGDTRVLGMEDVMKVDFGTHVNGYITDSAFTVCFDDRFKPLLDASHDGTWAGIRLAGPDAVINDVSAEIQEAIESYEMEWKGKTYPIKAIGNLGGHNILPYQIHGGDLILGAPSSTTAGTRMSGDTIYAIETFATTGTGSIVNSYEMETSHYMRPADAPRVPLKLQTSKQLLSHIVSTRSTLPFCTRWLDEGFGSRWRMGISELSKNQVVQSYPPLVDNAGSFTSQLEHTIFLHEYGKEVLSSGDDY